MAKMKDSGIKWIGEIPKEWNTNKIKFTTKIPITDGPHETPTFIDEGIPFYSVDGIQNGNIIYEPCRYISIEDANRYDKKIIPEYGDILMGKAASVGKIAIIDKKIRMQVWSPLAVIRTNESIVHNVYLKYYLLSDSAQIEIDLKSTTNTQKNIAMEDIKNIILPLPNLNEQILIAEFLNNKVDKINKILNYLKNQIDILNKYKKSLITETVTKGLNTNAEMKNSGNEWIGKIPETWKCKKLKYLLKSPLMYGANESGEEYDEGCPRYIRITDIDENNKLKEDGRLSLLPDVAKPYILEEGDILFARSGATVGKTFIYKKEYGKAAFAGYLIKANINEKLVLPQYVYYSTLGEGYDNWRNSVFTQATIQNIGADKYALYVIPVPSIVEQQEIVNYLDKKCAQIDELIVDKQKQIEKIEQYKKSLIYEYVTGKKRVKGAEELYG